jgi:hypothetical protein
VIDVLIPVLGRPHRAATVVNSIREHQTVDTTIVFLCSPGDTEQARAACMTDADMVVTVDWEPDRGDYARKINRGFALTSSPWVFTAADDVSFTAGWDRIALTAADRMGRSGVVGTQDECNQRTRGARHSTHSLVGRDYVERVGGTFDRAPGVVLHEGYWHNYCDDELVTAARRRGVYSRSEAVVRHHHPSQPRTGGVMDATYEKGMERFSEDRHMFARRQSSP